MFFHALTFAGSRGRCLSRRPTGLVLQHLQKDTASVNAMKQTCEIVILPYIPYSNQIRTGKAFKVIRLQRSGIDTIKYHT